MLEREGSAVAQLQQQILQLKDDVARSQNQGERFDQWGEAYFSSRAKNEGTDPSEYWQKRRQAVLDNTGYFFMVCSLLPSLSSLSFCCSRPPLVLSFDSVK